MATIHTGTTMAPTKLELLSRLAPAAALVPRTPAAPPRAARGPAASGSTTRPGEVGIEFAFVTDARRRGDTYAVPMTYRGHRCPARRRR